MKMNRKAEGGFMESIASMMVVIIALTAFLSLVLMAFADHGNDREIPKDILNGIEVVNGKITSGTDMESFVSTNGYASLKLTLKVIGTDDVIVMHILHSDSDEMIHDSGTLLISVDGRKMNAEYELAVWI